MGKTIEQGFLRTYKTSSGKDVIEEYIVNIDDVDEALYILDILNQVNQKGARWLLSDESTIWTQYWHDKIFEIKYGKHRVFYCYMKNNVVYMLHGCKKVKGKTTSRDSKIVKKRYKEASYE